MKLVGLIKMCLNETYSRVWVGKHFLLRMGLNKEMLYCHCFSTLLQSMPVGGKPEQLEIKLLAYADDVNTLGRSVHMTKKNTEALELVSKEIRLEVNVDKSRYLVMSGDQIAGQSHNMKTDNVSSERVEQFKYLGTTLINQNSIQEEIKSRMKSGNACCHSVQNLLSSSLQLKNIEIKIHRTVILPVILYRCATSLLTLREEFRLRVFDNRVLGRTFGPKRNKVTMEWRKLQNEKLNNLYTSPNIIRVTKLRRDGRRM